MAGNGSVQQEHNLDSMEARHKREIKELQGQIQAIKKSIPRGDKKKNKECKSQIAVIEKELSDRHEREMKEFEANHTAPMSKVQAENAGHIGNDPNLNGISTNDGKEAPKVEKVSKARRKREKKAQKAKQQAEAVANAEADYVNTRRYAEEEKIKERLANLNLKVKPMISDGNCLYYAIEDQLKTRVKPINSSELRTLTSKYMLNHADDFLPFLTKPDSDDCYSIEEFEKYCHDIAETAAWGGQVELRALSHVLQTPIHVIQADVPSIEIGDEYKQTPIMLTYHRHEFGLGEHYNSVEPKSPENEEEG